MTENLEHTLVLHLIPGLSGEDSSALLAGLAQIGEAGSVYQHSLISLEPLKSEAISQLREAGFNYVPSQDRLQIRREIETHDLIHLHWQNSPKLAQLLRSELPPARLLIQTQIGPEQPSQPATWELLHYGDLVLNQSGEAPCLIAQIYPELLRRPKRKHFWGVDMTRPLLTEKLSIADLKRALPKTSGSEIFVESLGAGAGIFNTSLHSSDLEEIFAAEQQISECSSALRLHALIPYSRHYANDGFLKLWSGLANLGAGCCSEALSDFQEALKTGCRHWRLHWYSALAAIQAQNWDQASLALNRVIEVESDFDQPRSLLDELNRTGIAIRNKALKQTDWIREITCLALPDGSLPKLFSLLRGLGLCVYAEGFDKCWRPAPGGFQVQSSLPELARTFLADSPAGQEVVFAEPVGFRAADKFPGSLFSHRFVYLTGDSRSAFLERHKHYQARLGESAALGLNDALDLPLLPEEGSLFELGPLEEFSLQAKLIGQLAPKHSTLHFPLDQLLQGESKPLSQLLEFAGVVRTPEQIAAALQSFSQRTPAAAVDWDLPEYTQLNARFSHLTAALQRPDAPAAPKPPAAGSWPEEAKQTAQALWLAAGERRLRAALACDSERLAPFAETLGRFCETLEDLPLLQISFCRLLLDQGTPDQGSPDEKTSAAFAEENLRNLSLKGSRFVKLLATAALRKAFPDSKKYNNQFFFYLSQLDTGGALKEQDYYVSLLKSLGF